MQNLKHISFNRLPYTGCENDVVMDAINRNLLAGDNHYGKRCEEWFDSRIEGTKTLLTP